jgi:hypothetical protein
MSLMTVGDPTLCQIVGRHFERHAISGEDANSIAPKLACQVRQHRSLLIELHTEKSAGKLLHYCSCYFYTVFFTHSPLMNRLWLFLDMAPSCHSATV